MWNVVVIGAVRKQLSRIPRKDASRIIEVLEEMKNNPFSGDLLKISTDTWRRRVGSYRIFYKAYSNTRTVFVFDAKRRTSKTY